MARILAKLKGVDVLEIKKMLKAVLLSMYKMDSIWSICGRMQMIQKKYAFFLEQMTCAVQDH